MAIANHTAMCINGLYPDSPDITLLTQELVIHHMQIDQSPANAQHHQQENAQHRAKAPGFQPCGQTLLPVCCLLSLTGQIDHPDVFVMIVISPQPETSAAQEQCPVAPAPPY